MQVQPGYYTHFKGGEYEVISVGYHSETIEKMVVYKALYETPNFPMGTIWVRPLALFTDTKEYKGITVPRFVRNK